jgi:hypothetical protein
MKRSDEEFHDFVVGFTDPLARLAFLLTDGTPIGTSTATIDALASVRRHWREAETNGAPESLAVEALLTGLPHRSKLPLQAQPPGELRGAGFDSDDADDALGDVAWTAWRGLDPRHRVPLLFADVSVASRRLVGLDVPASFGTLRQHNVVAGVALQGIREVLHADRRTRIAVDAMTDRQLTDQLVEVLRAHSPTAPIPTDPYPLVTIRVRNLRRRTLSAVAAVVVLLAGATVTATRLSAAKNPHQLATNHPPAAGLANVTSAANGGVTVDWPTRGDAATDTTLLNAVKALFVQAHPEATGDVHVLLATDTPAFRIAYVTANSTGGVIQSWFSGPVGADQLFEGAFSYAGAVQADTVLATIVTNSSEKAELVVIAPPTASDMKITDFDGTPAGLFAPLASADGIAVKDVSTIETSKLTLSVQLGAANQFVRQVPRAQLGSNAVERGTADPGLLAAALVAADTWRRAGTIAPSSVPVALWGGTDALGTDLIVVRLKTGDSIDGLLVEWSDATAIGSARPALPLNRPANRHYGVGKGQPDFPLAFRYGSVQVGVVVPAGIATAVLVVNGDEAPPVRVDAEGFASMIMPGIAEPASDLTLQVDLYDTTGGIVRTLPVPLPA